MKKLFSILCAFIITGTGFSQQTAGTVTINVTGNRTKQITVDSKPYTITNATSTAQQPVVISDLASGTHALEIVRNSNNRSTTSKSSFTLRNGYDLTVNVSADGSISLTETRIANANIRGSGNAVISTAAYNKLYAAVQKKPTSATRGTYLESEFNSTNKKFTAKQASALIQLVNSESLRLKLAKQSYTKISDQQNFSLVSALLSSSANKTDLNTYIASVPLDDQSDLAVSNGNAFTPMTNQKFQLIYNEVIAESNAADKTYYLTNFFGKDNAYFSAAQARQLIQLVSTDQDRFNLAKSSFRGITDRENFSNVAQLVTNSYNRAELMTYASSYDINNNTGTGTTGQAMSSTNFTKLYQNISYQNNYTTRYNSLVTAFGTAGNYFTTAQAKQLIPMVSDENSRLLLSKSAYNVLTDRANYTQFNDFLTTQSSRNDLANYVMTYNNTGVISTGTVMSDVEFTNLYKSINSAWTAGNRYNLASGAFQNTNNYFTTYQVRQVLQLINSETDKLSLAKLAYDNTTDQANYNQLYDLFPTTASKNDLAKFVTDAQYGTGTGTVVKTAMAESAFNSLVRDVQFTFGIGAKMGVLTGIFNKETNFFTTAQAKQLIQMVSAEANRLELAKAAYNNITDPTNFNQLFDIFSSQTSKDELNAYVGANAYLNK